MNGITCKLDVSAVRDVFKTFRERWPLMSASEAWANAKLEVEFKMLESDEEGDGRECRRRHARGGGDEGLIRLRLEAEFEPHDDSYIDTWDDWSEKKREFEKTRIAEMIERDGLWILIAEWRALPDEDWEAAESVGDLVGKDGLIEVYSTQRLKVQPCHRWYFIKQALLALNDERWSRADDLAERATYATSQTPERPMPREGFEYDGHNH